MLHCSGPAGLVPPYRWLSGRYHYCFRPSASAAGSARFDPAAPAVGVSRRDKNCRKMTYSRVGTQKHEDQKSEKIGSAKIDDLIAVGSRRSKAERVGRDTGQWCRMWKRMQERRGQAQWGRGTHTRRSHSSHVDHWALEDDPGMDVRTMSEVVGVEERQGEGRRCCGDACDSLCCH